MKITQRYLAFLIALTLPSTALMAGETKTKAELEQLVKTANNSLLMDKLVVNKPTGDMLNSLSFNFDADLIRAMGDTHIRRFFNATGKNLQATLWVDKKYWEQSQYFDQYMAVVTEKNAFKRKRAEQVLKESIASAPDVTDKIVGQKFILASRVKSTYEFDFDTMSKRFTDDLGGPGGSYCLPQLSTTQFRSVRTPPSKAQTNDHSVLGYGNSKVKTSISGAGFQPEIIFQKPIEGSFADLISPMATKACAFQASFDDVEKAERFEEIMTGGAVIYYTGEITMYESPKTLIAILEKAELYTVNSDTGEIGETQFSWNVTKSLNPIESLTGQIEQESNSEMEYSELINSPVVYATGPGTDDYLQFKDGGKRLFMTKNRESVAEYELGEMFGQPVYEMVKAVGKPKYMPLRIFMPKTEFRVSSAGFLNFYSIPSASGYGFRVQLQGDLEQQLSK